MAVSEIEPTKLFANLGLSALALGAFYFIVAFIVLRNVRHVPSLSPPNWNTLRVFCIALLIFPLLRGIAFTFHFFLKEGENVGINWPSVLKDTLMNLIFLFPSFVFLLVYIILICIWIEITLFSRDQYLIQRDSYSKLWKSIYITIVLIVLSGVIACFILTLITHSPQILAALFFTLWVMDFLIPALAAIIYIILIIRFAGFPYYDDIWKQQSQRINKVIIVWTLADVLSGTMIALWSDKSTNNKHNWTNEDSHLWFQISVFGTIFITEIAPILWVSEWSNLGFLIIAFDQWRTMFIENPRTAQQHAPLLNDDPQFMVNKLSDILDNNNNNNKNNDKNVSKSDISSRGGRKVPSEIDSLSSANVRRNGNDINISMKASKYYSLTGGPATSKEQSERNHSLMSGVSIQSGPETNSNVGHKSSMATIINLRKAMDFTEIKIDMSMNLTAYIQTPFSQSKKGECGGVDICLKSLLISNLPTSMVQQAINDVERFCIEWDHSHLATCYGVRIVDNNNNVICINSSDYEELNDILTNINSKLSKSLKKFEIINKWYSNGSLWDIIEAAPKDTPFAPQVILRIALQISQFLKWLHLECNSCHGYLKSRNILFDDNMNVKITDIGLIGIKRQMQIMLSGDCKFEGYWLDSEFFEGKAIKKECDIWAFGFILYELISKRNPFDKCSFEEMKKKIVKHQLPEIPNHCPPYIRSIINKCWIKNRSKRVDITWIINELHKNL